MDLPNLDEMQAEVDDDQAMLLMKRAVVDQMKDADDRMKAAAQAWQNLRTGVPQPAVREPRATQLPDHENVAGGHVVQPQQSRRAVTDGRRAAEEGPTSSGKISRPSGVKEENVHLSEYPTMVSRAGGENFVELKCHFCKGNASKNTGQFLQGLRGFMHHINLKHLAAAKRAGVNIITKQCVLEHAAVRNIDAAMVERYLRGEPLGVPKETAASIEKIAAYGSVGGYPTIISLPNDSLVELRCSLCGCNARPIRNTAVHFRGMPAFQSHLHQIHKWVSPGRPISWREWVLELCNYRVLTAAEVDMVKARQLDPPALVTSRMPPSMNGVQRESASTAKATRVASDRVSPGLTDDSADFDGYSFAANSDFLPETSVNSRKRRASGNSLRNPKKPPRATCRRATRFDDSGVGMTDGFLDGDLNRETITTANTLPGNRVTPQLQPDSSTSSTDAPGTSLILSDGSSLHDYCPCLVLGHPCQNITCNKLEPQGVAARTCTDITKSGRCPDVSCGHGRDHLEARKRMAVEHLRQNHDHDAV
ncbi:hypothetical protein LTS18_007839 [Coniosporium uncinatum]|uniref:Uncharacterized protein n=1 Tax=Coniosporium uncinatum TaxID=93489 RepID=A0ACC3DZW0_9PEZI|nr:hypothetical protein LTS18_007839 [Coniosporium uncinatum]